MNNDINIRTAAMNNLDKLRSKYGEVIPYRELKKGFQFQGEKIHYLSPQGIFKPTQLNLPLTITTTYNGPYEDKIGNDFLTYKYRGDNESYVEHRDNVGLRKCMRKHVPLIYLHGVEVGQYVAIYPVFIIDDDMSEMEFTVAADDIRILSTSQVDDVTGEKERRKYITREVKHRIHQSGFRARIMRAYKETCAFCRLKHANLLDAAHIVPDSENGSNEVQNGMALCKIHHAAFDQHVLGVDPDYKIHVRDDILKEIDGPMLKHGLQELNDQSLFLPNGDSKPKRNYLEYRYQKFLTA